jgi:hypothetical protein
MVKTREALRGGGEGDAGGDGRPLARSATVVPFTRTPDIRPGRGVLEPTRCPQSLA